MMIMIFTKTRSSKENSEKRLIICAFLLIPVIMLILFTYYPFFSLIRMSFSDWNGFSPHMKFIGLDNYKQAFASSEVWFALKNNLAYLIINILQNIVGFYFAIVLNMKIRGRNFYRSVLFMPYIMNGIAVAFMFNYLFDYTNGPLNLLLNYVNLPAVHWFPANYLINFSLASIGFWQYMGYGMVIYLTGLQSIPKELFEAASIDGANGAQLVRHIILPNMKTIIELNFFLGINGSLQAYFLPFIITHGGPYGLSDTVMSKALTIAFTFGNYGKSAAMSMILLLIVFIVIGVQHKFMGGRED